MSTSELLNNFHQTRKEALTEIQGLQITPQHYSRTAIHPDFGEVKLSQLLSAWVVHDLSQPVRRSAALLQSSTAKRLAPGFPFYEFSIKAYEKIGFVGGISWSSTLDYYRLVNEEVNRRLGGLHYAECILYSVNFHHFRPAMLQAIGMARSAS